MKLKIRFVGDICLIGDIQEKILSSDSKKLFYCLEEPDSILVGNLESPISIGGVSKKGKFACFQSNPEIIDSLLDVDMLSLSNNHITDFGHESAFQTKKILEENGIKNVGYGKNSEESLELSIIEKNGVKVGVGTFSCLTTNGFNIATSDVPGVATYSLQLIREIIPKWKSKVDVLFVFFHWGLENNHSIVEDQMIVAHACIDAGADSIVGTHGHVIQPYEIYNGKPIFYGLGNLVFSDFDYEYMDASGKNIKGRYIQKKTNLESLSPVFTIDVNDSNCKVKVDRVDSYKFENDKLEKINLQGLSVDVDELNYQISGYFSRSAYMRNKKKNRGEIDYLSEFRYPNVVYFYNSNIIRRKSKIVLVWLDALLLFSRIKNKVLFKLNVKV